MMRAARLTAWSTRADDPSFFGITMIRAPGPPRSTSGRLNCARRSTFAAAGVMPPTTVLSVITRGWGGVGSVVTGGVVPSFAFATCVNASSATTIAPAAPQTRSAAIVAPRFTVAV